jgi:hypothetical protein
MTSLPQARTFLPKPDRRFFLLSLSSLGAGLVLPHHGLKAENRSEPSYRFRTPECEVRMSVQFIANSSTEGFHFRDRLANRSFCLSANGGEGQGCLEKFVGAMAIARYVFRSRPHSAGARPDHRFALCVWVWPLVFLSVPAAGGLRRLARMARLSDHIQGSFCFGTCDDGADHFRVEQRRLVGA